MEKSSLCCAAGELAGILIARDSDQLECFCHGRVDVDEVYEVVYGCSEPEPHRCLMDDLSGTVADHRDAKHPVGVCVGNHLDNPPLVANGASPGDKLHRDGTAPAVVSLRYSLCCGEADNPNLPISDNG